MGGRRLPLPALAVAALLGVLVILARSSAGLPQPVTVAGEPEALEANLKGRADVLFFGGYETAHWPARWGVGRVQHAQNCTVVSDPSVTYQGHSLRVRYPAGSHGGNSRNRGGCQYFVRFEPLRIRHAEELHLRYYVRFDPGFDFVQGGKLPGLAGGASNSGGRVPNGRDGFSVRLMWRRGGRLVVYAYLPTSERYGTDFRWDYGGTWRALVPGRWTSLEIRVKLNTPALSDGEIDCWMDGEKACEVRNVRFRDISTLRIDNIFFSTFFGGNTDDWAPTKDEFASFDNFVLATSLIGP